MTPMLDGPRFAPRAAGAPTSLVVLLHGYGSNGNDLIQLAPHLSKALPHTQFVSPDAPQPLSMPGAPPDGRMWFPITALDPDVMAPGVAGAAATLERFLDAELTRYALTPDRLALVGFSQGAMMAMHVGPRRTPAPAAIVGLSGALCGAEALKREVVARPPVLLAHGDQDDVVPPGRMFEAATGLAEAGLTVRWTLERGLPHAVGPQGLGLAAEFLARALTGAGATLAPA